MKPYKKVILTGALLSALTFSGGMALAQDTNASAGVSASSTTPIKDARLEARAEAKAKIDAAKAEEKAKRDATKAAEKAKREEIKKQKEAFVLKTAQDKFAKAIADAEAGIAAAQAKLTEAKAAAAAATDRTTFEAARKLFMQARQLLEKGMRPLRTTPQVGMVTTNTPTLEAGATAQ